MNGYWNCTLLTNIINLMCASFHDLVQICCGKYAWMVGKIVLFHFSLDLFLLSTQKRKMPENENPFLNTEVMSFRSYCIREIFSVFYIWNRRRQQRSANRHEVIIRKRAVKSLGIFANRERFQWLLLWWSVMLHLLNISWTWSQSVLVGSSLLSYTQWWNQWNRVPIVAGCSRLIHRNRTKFQSEKYHL